MGYIGLDEVASFLRGHVAEAPLELEGSFEPIAKGNGKTVGAVDSGSGVIWDAASFIVGAHRSGFRIYEAGKLKEREIGDLEICIAQNQRSLDSIREEDELRRTEELAAKLDGILLLDGVLPKIKLGVAIGISKSSSRSLGTYPLIPSIMRKGREIYPRRPWCYTGEEGTFALFHPLSQYLFRLEIEQEDPWILGDLLSYCNDPIYLGYPFPLALIHNDVVITYELMADVLYSLQGEEPSLLQMEKFHRRLDENLW